MVYKSKASQRLKGRLKPKQKQKSKSKYKNIKVTIHGITFDSKKEAARYLYLKDQLRQGGIKDLELQPAFVIAGPVMLDGKKRPARKYKADFSYINHAGEYVVEDVKGMKTDMYKLKRHLVKELHGIEVIEI